MPDAGLTYTLAGATLPPTISWRIIGVRLIEAVAIHAIGLCLLVRSLFAPLAVYLMRNGFHVGRIHAGMIPTQMVDFQSIWNRLNELAVRPAVSSHHLARFANRKGSITFAVSTRCPYPASIWGDMNLTPETQGK